MFSIDLLFEISYAFDANFIFFLYLFFFLFAELGRLYRYDSSSECLRNLRWFRCFDLLVWNSADTTRKRKCIVVIVANVHDTLRP